LTEIDFAYIAGMIDGEGTITLTRTHPNQFRTPVLSLSSTTPELLLPAQEAFGGRVQTKKASKAHHAIPYEWRLRGHAALRAIERLLPYLRHPEKARRAKLLLGNYNRVTVRNGKYTESQRHQRLLFESEFLGAPVQICVDKT